MTVGDADAPATVARREGVPGATASTGGGESPAVAAGAALGSSDGAGAGRRTSPMSSRVVDGGARPDGASSPPGGASRPRRSSPPTAPPTAAEARRALAGVASRAVVDDDLVVVEAWATVVWNLVTEPGDGIAGRLVGAVGALAALRVFDDPSTAAPILSASELDAGLARWRPRLDTASVADAVADATARAHRAGVRLVTRADAVWPAALADLGDHAPLCLWALGDPGRLGDPPPGVALVGARAATGYGEHVAMEFAADLAGSGVAVVSGAAYGIDGAAHRAALTAGGPTIALLAGGLDRPYPAGHAQLIDRIAAAGVVLGEVPCGASPTKWRFLQRNRVIAALADATVVVEAGWRSGSLNTAGHAAALGRPLGAVPGPVTSAASAGCHRLLREYDARCVTSAADVRELLGIAEGGIRDRTGPSRERTRVLDALSARTARSAADIARRTGMSESETAGILGLLDLEGIVVSSATGWRRA